MAGGKILLQKRRKLELDWVRDPLSSTERRTEFGCYVLGVLPEARGDIFWVVSTLTCHLVFFHKLQGIAVVVRLEQGSACGAQAQLIRWS